MTDAPAEQPAPAEPEKPSESARLDTIESKIDRLFDLVTGSGGEQASEPEPEPDVKTETRNAVAEVKRREAARQKRAEEKAANEKRLAAVEEAVKEKPPREYRRVTRWMRWEDKKDEG